MSLSKKVKTSYQNRLQILEGIKNNIFKSDAVEAIAQERLLICRACEYHDTEGSECLVPGTAPCCGDCGCPLNTKTRSLSAGCPKGKWTPVLTEQEELDHDILDPSINNQNT